MTDERPRDEPAPGPRPHGERTEPPQVSEGPAAVEGLPLEQRVEAYLAAEAALQERLGLDRP